MNSTLQSYIAGRWLGTTPAQTLRSALDGRAVAATHAETIDFAEAVDHARRVGVPALMKTDFQQRAAILKALAKLLLERKEELYAVSAHTGATRADSWVDIEGGSGTLFAYASVAGNELPSGNLVHEGPAIPLGKQGRFAGTHVLVPRGGVAVAASAGAAITAAAAAANRRGILFMAGSCARVGRPGMERLPPLYRAGR